MGERKHDWSSIYRQYGVQNCQELINLYKSESKAALEIGMHRSVLNRRFLLEKRVNDNKLKNVLIIADHHDKPNQSKEHLKHIAWHIRDTKPDVIIILGDFADFESLCSHVRNDTAEGKLKPAVYADLQSLKQALTILVQESGRSDIIYMLGNHEHRIWDFENNSPEIANLLSTEFYRIVEQSGISKCLPYKSYYAVSGVDFTHIPMNGAGKPYGGKTVCQTVARDAVRDIVFAHVHRYGVHNCPKVGPDRGVTAISCPIAMPDGQIPHYCENGMMNWDYGILEVDVQNGKIKDSCVITLEKLKRRYA